ncbi:MAG: hypothetical protein H6732_16085 [Alphaproteobacteria bacterium]|nr:hypothetical protein [Alphaproteobacteria bacterium]
MAGDPRRPGIELTPVDRMDDRLARLDRWAADPVVHRVVEELAASGAWSEALERARAGIRAGVDRDRVLLHLLEGALTSRRADRAQKALGQLTAAGRASPEGRRAAARVLEAEGRVAEAVVVAEQLLLDHPDDPWAGPWLRRHKGGPGLTGAGPLETERRVRALVAAGFPGRALRVARRIRVAHPHDELLGVMLVELADDVAVGRGAEDPLLDGLPLPELEDGSDVELELELEP